ncbi:MAG TPA: hypothetical protein VGH02_13745 [Rhizomicrobium sp.]|jgi:hypothetical protein
MSSIEVSARPKVGFFASLDMRLLRQWHRYLGVFFAPAIIFFAFSGALQTFSLHEGGHGSSYEPPAWIVTIASVHKDQRLPHAKPKHAAAPKMVETDHDKPDDHTDRAPSAPSPLPLKIFVLSMAIGLITSALLGITIALRNKSERRISLILLTLGVLMPISLLFL